MERRAGIVSVTATLVSRAAPGPQIATMPTPVPARRAVDVHVLSRGWFPDLSLFVVVSLFHFIIKNERGGRCGRPA